MPTFNLRDCIDEILPEKVHVVKDTAEYFSIKDALLCAGILLKQNVFGKNILLSAETDIQSYPGKKFFLLYQDIETV